MPLLGAVDIPNGGNLGHQSRPADDLLQAPALQLRKRPGLLEPHHVADVSFIVLIVRIKLLVVEMTRP